MIRKKGTDFQSKSGVVVEEIQPLSGRESWKKPGETTAQALERRGKENASREQARIEAEAMAPPEPMPQPAREPAKVSRPEPIPEQAKPAGLNTDLIFKDLEEALIKDAKPHKEWQTPWFMVRVLKRHTWSVEEAIEWAEVNLRSGIAADIEVCWDAVKFPTNPLEAAVRVSSPTFTHPNLKIKAKEGLTRQLAHVAFWLQLHVWRDRPMPLAVDPLAAHFGVVKQTISFHIGHLKRNGWLLELLDNKPDRRNFFRCPHIPTQLKTKQVQDQGYKGYRGYQGNEGY